MGAVPFEYRSRLGQMHDRCSPKPFSEIHQSLKKELGENYDVHFLKIEEEATAAASIAQVVSLLTKSPIKIQVHRGWLKSGQSVAIKVQYPTLQKAVVADLGCLLFLSRISEVLFPHYPVHWMFLQLKRQIAEEMDFTIEIQNAKNVEAKLRHRKDIR